jgi:hypothetical protein
MALVSPATVAEPTVDTWCGLYSLLNVEFGVVKTQELSLILSKIDS